MRQIEQFVQVLAQILFNKKNTAESIQQLDHLAQQYLGLDLKMLESMSGDEILSFMEYDTSISSLKIFIAAEILRKRCEAQKVFPVSKEKIFAMYFKALQLYFEAFNKNRDLAEETDLRLIQDMIQFVRKYKLAPSFKFNLFQYYESCGQFDHAENILYELIEERYRNIRDEGVKFYHRLLLLTDKDLEKGNLPRREILEGLQTIAAMQMK